MKMKSQKAPLVRLMKLVRGASLRRWELRINEGLLARDGVKRFAATVMAEALLDLYHRGSTRYAKDALAWLRSDERNYVFSFVPLCDQFDIDPLRMRNDVLEDIRCGRTKLGGKLHVDEGSARQGPAARGSAIAAGCAAHS
jgi:hypothetical protein